MFSLSTSAVAAALAFACPSATQQFKPSLVGPSCLVPVCAPASAYRCVVLACPSVGSDSVDEVGQRDDPQSLRRGAAVVALPGGSNSENEV